jgi:hypothetical protein
MDKPFTATIAAAEDETPQDEEHGSRTDGTRQLD